ncbi:MAG: carbohydrate-binding family 9-like protein [Gemmatimonadota bacterium]|nr:carbohydrate-binding family 9-like protein [Gemmatimonadota bacterium]
MKKVFFIIPAACMFALTLIVSMHAAENNPAGAQLATHHYTVKRAGSPITVDGRLDEPLWSKAEPVSFVKKNGGQPEQATKAWVVWDDSYIYFAWDCEDSHIWSTMEKRDEPLYNEEVVEVFISADGDNTSYLEIEVNPLGTLWDGYIVNTVKRRVGILAWNSTGLKWAVHLDGTLNDREETDKGWSVEMALPLNDIFTAPNKPPKAGDRWRINLYRIDLPDGPGNPGEPCAWSPVSGETFHDPDRFGEIVFSAEVVR